MRFGGGFVETSEYVLFKGSGEKVVDSINGCSLPNVASARLIATEGAYHSFSLFVLCHLELRRSLVQKLVNDNYHFTILYRFHFSMTCLKKHWAACHWHAPFESAMTDYYILE